MEAELIHEKNEILIFVPTYNESENVRPLYLSLKGLELPADILFLDDNSPDGTGEIMDEIASVNKEVHVIHRMGKLGIGSAHREGIAWAYAHGYRHLVTMDADFTHSPEYIPHLLKCLDDAAVGLGSRYMEKKSLAGWNIIRRTLTMTAHFLTTHLLGLTYDSTGAFRAYDLKTIPKGIFDLVESNSYSFFFESLHIINFNHFKISEISIRLPPRTYGSSKMSFRDAFISVGFLLKMCYRTYLRRQAIRLETDPTRSKTSDL